MLAIDSRKLEAEILIETSERCTAIAMTLLQATHRPTRSLTYRLLTNVANGLMVLESTLEYMYKKYAYYAEVSVSFFSGVLHVKSTTMGGHCIITHAFDIANGNVCFSNKQFKLVFPCTESKITQSASSCVGSYNSSSPAQDIPVCSNSYSED